ncbi:MULTISPECIES: ABC transporter permease subunit [Ferroplasma]|uniref:Uncharacterized protein n=2 Tax=Ferroplasma TaxID=74968 RepID=S0APU2_FERAC|nr:MULTISPECIES: ABC transporter permease subunit [Ferroplasma]AGO60921.1 hypothetical protein FACI_IFERC00001G0941 [Ferroplasma acidarmanus Fer1]
MNGFLYDIKRTITGKFTIILIVLLVLVTAASAYGAGVSSDYAHPGNTAIVMPYINQTGNSVNITDYVINGYGDPVSGLHITSSLYYNLNNSLIKHFSGTTNGTGYVHFSIKNLSTNLTYRYNEYYRDGIALVGSNNTMNYYNGQNILINDAFTFAAPYYSINFNDSKYPLYAVNLKDKSDPALVSTMIYNPDYKSTDSPDVYYNTSSTLLNTDHFNKTNTVYIGKVNSNRFIVTPPLKTADAGKSVNIYIVNSTGAVIVPFLNYEYTYIKPGSILQDELAIFFGVLLIPIMGIFSAYFYYSKDKTSGVLESIIVRPITKGKLMMSRFAGNSVSFLAGLLIALGLADFILYHYTGVFISSGTFLTILLGYLVEIIGFAGIIYLVSQFEKTQGQVLGTGLGMLFIMGFMWSTIVSPAILYLLRVKSTGIAYFKDLLIVNSFSPSYFPDLISDYHLGSYSTYKASAVGINIYSIIAVGLIWILVPSLLALYFARKKD